MKAFGYTIPQMAKAIVGALIAGLTALGTALTDEEVTQSEWVLVALALLGTFGGVFGVKNAPPGDYGDQRGAVQWPVAIALILLIIILLVVIGVLQIHV